MQVALSSDKRLSCC